MKPVTILLIDTLATDFDFNVLDQVVTDPVEPSELSGGAVS
jgi:hypothetical protein